MELILKPNEQEAKTWTYTETTNGHTTHHTIAITDKRFVHETELKEAKQQYRKRSEIAMKNVKAVETFYGNTVNLPLAILLFFFGALLLIGAIAMFAGEGGAVGAVLLVVALVLVVIGIIVLKMRKPAFAVRIDTMGYTDTRVFSHGKTEIDMGPRGGIFGALFARKNGKCILKMPAEVGNEIVDTIGLYCFD